MDGPRIVKGAVVLIAQLRGPEFPNTCFRRKARIVMFDLPCTRGALANAPQMDRCTMECLPACICKQKVRIQCLANSTGALLDCKMLSGSFSIHSCNAHTSRFQQISARLPPTQPAQSCGPAFPLLSTYDLGTHQGFACVIADVTRRNR